MDIHALRVSVTDDDLNDLVTRYLLEDLPVEELTLAVTDEGVVAKGQYPMLLTVSFETVWALSVAGGKVAATLVRFRTLGMPMGVLKSLVMGVISSAAKKESWLAVEGDTVVADVDGLLARDGHKVRSNLRAIRCQAGLLVIEADEPP
jgi:hypothetical protein